MYRTTSVSTDDQRVEWVSIKRGFKACNVSYSLDLSLLCDSLNYYLNEFVCFSFEFKINSSKI